MKNIFENISGKIVVGIAFFGWGGVFFFIWDYANPKIIVTLAFIGWSVIYFIFLYFINQKINERKN